MIVRFFNTGTSNGESPVRYLMRATDHEGNTRPEAPVVLEGSPETTVAIINSITRKHKYASGCLAFRADEKPTKAELFNILDQFKAVVASGLEPEQFNALFVLHQEATDPKTGLAGFHVHFVLPMTLLSGTNAKGQRLAGKRWNPHPPGKQTIEVMSLFTQITNHEHGWKTVESKPSRVGMDSLWRKSPHLNQKRKVDLLHIEAMKAIKSGAAANRQGLMHFMEDELGLTITRASEKTVSVKFPGTGKAIKLRGPAYEYQSDYKALITQLSTTGHSDPTNMDQAKERLAQLLSHKAQQITNTPTTTRREQVYGRKPKQQSTATRAGQTTQRGAFPPKGARGTGSSKPQNTGIKSGMERDMLQSHRRQWRDSHGRSDTQNGQRLGDAASQAQQTVGVRQEPHSTRGGSGGQWWGRPISTFNAFAEIDEQIRTLSIQLNDCEIGSLEAKALSDQLKVIQGIRQSQYGAPSSTKKIKPR